MKKVDSFQVPAIEFTGKKELILKVSMILEKNYNFCEYVKFGAISWKFDILSITTELESKSPFAHMWHI